MRMAQNHQDPVTRIHEWTSIHCRVIRETRSYRAYRSRTCAGAMVTLLPADDVQ